MVCADEEATSRAKETARAEVREYVLENNYDNMDFLRIMRVIKEE